MKYQIIDTYTGKVLNEFGLYADCNGVVRDRNHRIAKGCRVELIESNVRKSFSEAANKFTIGAKL